MSPQVKPTDTSSMFTHLESPECGVHIQPPFQWDQTLCLLVVMCQDCVNPVPQVCVRTCFGSSLQLTGSALSFSSWSRMEARPLRLPSEKPTAFGTDKGANPLSLPAAEWFDSQYLPCLKMFFFLCFYQVLHDFLAISQHKLHTWHTWLFIYCTFY